MQIQDKIAVITGAGSGIGRALALGLAPQCRGLALCDVDAKTLEETKAMLPASCSVFAATVDVSQLDAVREFASKVVDQLGAPDIVINNAGVALGRYSVDDLPYEEFEWIVGINFWGMVYGSKEFLPYMKDKKEAFIGNVSSVFGMMGIAFQSPYCATKFAIRGFTESFRMEAMQTHPRLTVASIHPGGIKTNIAKSSRWPKDTDPSLRKKHLEDFEKVLKTTSEKAAKTIIKGIRRNKKRILIGPDARLVSFLTRIFPSSYVRIVGKRIHKRQAKVERDFAKNAAKRP